MHITSKYIFNIWYLYNLILLILTIIADANYLVSNNTPLTFEDVIN